MNQPTIMGLYHYHKEVGDMVYDILVGKPEGRKPPERPKYRWENNIKMDLKELG
jgi:hypothetical protein